jgi:hypothetical protein
MTTDVSNVIAVPRDAWETGASTCRIHPAFREQLAGLYAAPGKAGGWEVVRVRARRRCFWAAAETAWGDSVDCVPSGLEVSDRVRASTTVIFEAFNPATLPDIMWPGGSAPPSPEAAAALDKVLLSWDLEDPLSLRNLLNASRIGLPACITIAESDGEASGVSSVEVGLAGVNQAAPAQVASPMSAMLPAAPKSKMHDGHRVRQSRKRLINQDGAPGIDRPASALVLDVDDLL